MGLRVLGVLGASPRLCWARGRWWGVLGGHRTLALHISRPQNSGNPLGQPPSQNPAPSCAGPNGKRLRACCETIRSARTSQSLCGRPRHGPTSQNVAVPGRDRHLSAAQRKREGPRRSIAAVRMPRLRVSAREVREVREVIEAPESKFPIDTDLGSA